MWSTAMHVCQSAWDLVADGVQMQLAVAGRRVLQRQAAQALELSACRCWQLDFHARHVLSELARCVQAARQRSMHGARLAPCLVC